MLGNTWIKSSLSSPSGDSCVEVRHDPGTDTFEVRDSKWGEASAILTFTRPEWDAFVGGVNAGEFS
jgi:hypothetical protein